MSQALTRYQVLYESMTSRRRRPILPKGLDIIATIAGVRVKNARFGLGWLGRQAEMVDQMAAEMHNFSTAALDDEIQRIREPFVRGRQTDEAVRRALAVVREVARRATNEEAFLVQIMGAMALYHGNIVEMRTGEGKTLTGSLVCPLLAWQRRHVIVFTVNDYLAARDAESRRAIHERCLCSVGAITQEMTPQDRAPVYARSIVYGTPKQIVADWLRDQIRLGKVNSPWMGRHLMEQLGPDQAGSFAPMVPGLHAALVDEADAVLIDEGVVPLIIARSRREDDMAKAYQLASVLAQKLDEGPDFEVDKVHRRVDLKRRGEHRLEQMFKESQGAPGAAVFKAYRRGEELVRQALVARHCYLHGQQYQIVEGKVVLVDEYTGRFLADRQWEHGLHQSVEAKEGLEVTADRETLARMSFQKFYRSFPFLCGMTGTAADAKGEMERTYSRPVTIIPTNRPMIRTQWPTRLFRSSRDKWHAIVESIDAISAGRALSEDASPAGPRPILVGTRSITASELLSTLLAERGLPHQVLNAKNDKEEATIIAHAGRVESGPDGALRGSITVATNMAGRGTDITLDAESRAGGGLHVILTEMHGARRIDRQFIGRAGRQGDPGSAQLFLALDDELVTKYMPTLAHALKARAGLRFRETGELRVRSTTSRAAAALFRLAQRRSEAKDRQGRASVLRQDDWVEKHLPGV
jgi:preprotein translocase subunit SecA